MHADQHAIKRPRACTCLRAGLAVPQLEDAHTEAGEGVRGSIGGLRVAAGRQEWVQAVVGQPTDCAAHTPPERQDNRAAPAATVVHVGVEGRGLIGSLAFKDSLRCYAALLEGCPLGSSRSTPRRCD